MFCRGNDYKCVKTNSNGESSYVVNNGIGDYLCIYYLGSESYNYAFTPLKINMAPPKTTCEVISTSNPTNPTVNLPTSNMSSSTVIIKPTNIVTILKVSGISDGKTYSRNAKLDLSLNKKVNLKVTLKITGEKDKDIKFTKGKCTLKLGNYNLKKDKKYKIKFKSTDSNYDFKQTITIKTK